MIREQLVREPEPELPETVLAEVRRVLADREDVARAYVVRARRSIEGFDPWFTQYLELELIDPPVDELPYERVERLLTAASPLAVLLQDRDTSLGFPMNRALRSVRDVGVLVYERGGA